MKKNDEPKKNEKNDEKNEPKKKRKKTKMKTYFKIIPALHAYFRSSLLFRFFVLTIVLFHYFFCFCYRFGFTLF